MNAIGPIDPLSSIVTLQQDAVQQRAGIAVMKAQAQAEQTLVQMVDDASRQVEAEPPPGVGTRVDVRA